MKRSLTIVASLILALAVPALMLGQAGKAEQEVLAVVKQVNEALVKADIATLDKILGYDANVILANGQTAIKADVLDALRSGKMKYNSVENSNSKVRVYGNVAVVNTTENIMGRAFGNDINGQFRVTYVLVKRDGKWQGVQRQFTRIMPQPTGASAGK